MSENSDKLKRYGFSGYNKPKRTPKHKTKSWAVLAKEGDKTKLIRFGQQGVKTEGGSPSTTKGKARRKSFRARHGCDKKKHSKLTARYWACEHLW